MPNKPVNCMLPFVSCFLQAGSLYWLIQLKKKTKVGYVPYCLLKVALQIFGRKFYKNIKQEDHDGPISLT